MPHPDYPCAHCGQPLSRTGKRGRPPKYCSVECRAEHHNDARRRSADFGTCFNCGTAYPRTRHDQLYCSVTCRNQCSRRRWKRKNRRRERNAWAGTLDLRDQHLAMAPSDADLGRYYEALRSDPCAYCGDTAEEVDHIDPRSKGGPNTWDNYTAACGRCNSQKYNHTLIRFLLRERLAESIQDVVQQIEWARGG